MLTDESEKLNSEMPSVSSQDLAAGSQGAATAATATTAASTGAPSGVQADVLNSASACTPNGAPVDAPDKTSGEKSQFAPKLDSPDGTSAQTPEYLTSSEAAKLLLSANSGLKPDLSRPLYRFAKRTFDIVASGAAIVVLLVPGAILSAIICVKSPGASPLYSQLRVGRLKKDGTYKLFRMWKFRSMQPYADALLEELKDRNEADGPLFKIKDDPRIIPGVGAFIRRHSIDELAQLINVFKGDMSLVGPRPGLPVEVVLYDERAKRRLTVKPGCGGAWQAGPRSDSAFEEMVDLDLDYIRCRSIAHDLGLILGTVRTMIRGGGAY